jgi:hypothetical protein
MPPIPREIVLRAVETYGLAWTTQDPSLLKEIFTSDCIYVERAFDQKATFRGLDAIVKYWKYQICGKQSDIQFRHVESEMIRDADEPIAVVKWLAEFDNRREHRVGASSDKTFKRVRFCQLAKLIFTATDNDGSYKISYLEEYGQPMTGPGNQWPGLLASDEELGRRIRFDPLPATATEQTQENKTTVAVCNFCSAEFPSRTKLHRHLKSTDPREDGTPGQCVPIEDEEVEDVFVWITFSLGYCSNEDVENILRDSLLCWHRSVKENQDGDGDRHPYSTDDIDLDTFTWAVPPDWSSSAVVNIASVKMKQAFFERVSKNALVSINNQLLEGLTEGGVVRLHTLEVVDRPCVQARREFEKYEAFIPWALLQEQCNNDGEGEGEGEGEETLLDGGNDATGWSRHAEKNPCRRPLEETKAGQFVDRATTKRLRDATRLLRDGGRKDLGHFFDSPKGKEEVKVRLRSCTMDEPWQRFCQISISMRQPRAGYVESILGLLIQHARSPDASDEDLVAAALKFTENASHNSTRTTETNDLSPSFPTDFACLLEPALSRYERKAKVLLCGSNAAISDEMRESIDRMECSVLRKMEGKLDTLRQWVQVHCDKA